MAPAHPACWPEPAQALRGCAAVWLTALASAGCVPLPPPGESEIPPRPPRGTIEHFVLDGRVAVRDGDRSFSANLTWRHLPSGDEILVSTPLGQGLARLVRDAGGARLETADEKRYQAADLELLSAEVFGIPLPLAGMPRWVVGASADGASAQARDEHGRALLIAENGWHIEYAQYESEAAEALPSLVRLRREPVELRLRVDRWQLP